ncbi:hypothetical protein Srot_0072 [Segniliparus rotundus DSM 44985]|uniref:Major tail protein n=1 Tax=Segniliparus rotundus (strain ATCC BAA-972 / CDC 1076 / CIP 108378 / DSM 44985 / JCM 13578) TaxID=640132 RepID=D6Z9N8_SEGRD|nr:hypothetical protein [Segniliparus rotundus]ADG96565.1 hypothetical protein Srot_0072 [Segniliparus rotundus DSM 44985]
MTNPTTPATGKDYFGYGDVRNIFKPQPDSEKTVGGLFVGPKFIDVAEALDLDAPVLESLKQAGYLTVEGIRVKQDRPGKAINAFGGDELDYGQTSFSLTVAFDVLEYFNDDAQRLAYGKNNVTVTPATTSHGKRTLTKITAKQLDEVSLFILLVQGDKQARYLAPFARVTEVGEEKHVHDELVSTPLTARCFPYQGAVLHRNVDDGMKLPAGLAA